MDEAPAPSAGTGDLDQIRLTVLGQALIQYDLRADPWPDLAAFAAVLAQADACFTDLETAVRTPCAGPPTREDVFLHAADPVVLDCLKDLGISLLATANNHAWDLGTAGIVGLLDDLDIRGFTHAGCGPHSAAAAAPAYRRMESGTVGLVAAASGAVREGAAATAKRSGVNELRGCVDGGLDAGDAAQFFQSIAAAAEHADVVIAYHHNHILEKGGRRTPRWQCHFARRASKRARRSM